MTDQLLREVDEAVRADRMAALWQQYRGALVAGVVAILLATAGSTLWDNYQQKRGGEWLSQLSDAQRDYENGKYAEAATGFKTVADETHGDVQDMAHVWQARALVALGRKDEAVTLLKATSDSAGGLWGDLACLRLAGLDAKQATCLESSKNSPLAVQRHQWAAAHAWEAGDADKAIAALKALIADEQTPNANREEAQQWLATIQAQKDGK